MTTSLSKWNHYCTNVSVLDGASEWPSLHHPRDPRDSARFSCACPPADNLSVTLGHPAGWVDSTSTSIGLLACVTDHRSSVELARFLDGVVMVNRFAVAAGSFSPALESRVVGRYRPIDRPQAKEKPAFVNISFVRWFGCDSIRWAEQAFVWLGWTRTRTNDGELF